MNYKPFCGYWFYGGGSDAEMFSYFCSYGLLSNAPESTGNKGYSLLSGFYGSILS